MVLSLVAPDAFAQWLPEWIGTWQHPEPFHAPQPSGVRVAADGSVFALLDTTHHNSAHATLVRFEPDGRFGWLRESGDVSKVHAIELLDRGGVAIATDATVREYDRASGALLRQCAWDGVRVGADARYETHALAQSPQGDLLLAAAIDGDYVVLRCDRGGTILPTWRWSYGAADEFATRVTGIVALADGGAALVGVGRTRAPGTDAYRTVRFDAEGAVRFTDTEPGELGLTIAPVHLQADADGALVLAAAPENTHGSPAAQAWKIAADGRREWLVKHFDPSWDLATLDAEGFARAPDGDVILALTSSLFDLRVVRLAGADGAVRWNREVPVRMAVRGVALAPNGRILVAGYSFIGDGSGHTIPHLVELDADGALLRRNDALGLGSGDVRIAGGCTGWYVLGASPYDPDSGGDAIVQHYDAESTCAAAADDALFADGFEARR